MAKQAVFAYVPETVLAALGIAKPAGSCSLQLNNAAAGCEAAHGRTVAMEEQPLIRLFSQLGRLAHQCQK